MKHSISKRLALPVLLVLGTACGGGGGGGDTIAPTASLVSPATSGMTDQATIVVRGTATVGSDAITEVRVTDFVTTVAATTTDGFATWSATLPPSPSSSALRIEVDAGGATTEVTTGIRVQRQTALLIDPLAVEIDPVTGELFVLDLGRRELLLVDPNDGDRKVLSGPGVGGGVPFDVVSDVLLDLPGGRAFVLELATGSILEVDLASGDRELLVKSNPAAPLSLAGAHSIAPGRHLDEVLVVATDGLIAVELSTGKLTVISNDEPALGPPLVGPRGLAVDLASDEAYVVDASTDDVVRVELSSGKRTLLSEQGVAPGPFFSRAAKCAIDPLLGLLVTDEFGGLIAVDLNSGARTLVSGPSIGAGDALVQPVDVAVLDGVAWAADMSLSRLVQIDLPTGDRSPFAEGSQGTGPQLVSVIDMVTDPDSGRFLAADVQAPEPQLLRVLPVNGARAIVGSSTVGSGELFFGIRKLDVHPDLGLVLLVDGDDRVFQVNPTTGTRTVELEADGFDIEGIQTVAWEEGTATFLYTDGAADELRRFDKLTGTSTTIASSFGGPLDLRVVDGTAFLATEEALWKVDVATGDSVVVTSSSFFVGSGEPIERIVRIAPDRSGDVVYLRDLDANQILAVDVATGERTLVSGPGRGEGPPLFFGGAIALSKDGRTVFAHDLDSSMVLGVNVATGDRVVVAR